MSDFLGEVRSFFLLPSYFCSSVELQDWLPCRQSSKAGFLLLAISSAPNTAAIPPAELQDWIPCRLLCAIYYCYPVSQAPRPFFKKISLKPKTAQIEPFLVRAICETIAFRFQVLGTKISPRLRRKKPLCRYRFSPRLRRIKLLCCYRIQNFLRVSLVDP